MAGSDPVGTGAKCRPLNGRMPSHERFAKGSKNPQVGGVGPPASDVTLDHARQTEWDNRHVKGELSISLKAGRGIGAMLAQLVVVALIPACASIEFGNDGARVTRSGTIVSQNRPIQDFTELVFASEGTVTISQGQQPGLEIEADDNLQDYILVEMEGPTLNIRTQPNADIEPSRSVVFHIAAPSSTRPR